MPDHDAECVHCGKAHASFGLLPLCATCTRAHAAALRALMRPASPSQALKRGGITLTVTLPRSKP